MELVDNSVRPKPPDQDGGCIPSRAGTPKGSAHNISTTHVLHRSQRPKLHPKEPLPSRHTTRCWPLAGIRGPGDRIIIFIDMNKHIITGTLPKEFQRLGLLEATHLNWEGTKPSTFVFGKGEPIDGIFHSPELEITAVMQLSFYEGVGDHKTTIIDVTTRSVIGKFERRVVTTQSRRLLTRNEKSMKEYIKWTTQQCRLHKLKSRVNKVAASVSLGEVLPAHIHEMEQVDTQKSEIQLGGE
jgi:hypothetical protein